MQQPHPVPADNGFLVLHPIDRNAAASASGPPISAQRLMITALRP